MLTLTEIKNFALKQFNGEIGIPPVWFEYQDQAIVCPWYDPTSRYPLDDYEAVETYGLANVLNFCAKASEYLEAEERQKKEKEQAGA